MSKQLNVSTRLPLFAARVFGVVIRSAIFRVESKARMDANTHAPTRSSAALDLPIAEPVKFALTAHSKVGVMATTGSV